MANISSRSMFFLSAIGFALGVNHECYIHHKTDSAILIGKGGLYSKGTIGIGLETIVKLPRLKRALEVI